MSATLTFTIRVLDPKNYSNAIARTIVTLDTLDFIDFIGLKVPIPLSPPEKFPPICAKRREASLDKRLGEDIAMYKVVNVRAERRFWRAHACAATGPSLVVTVSRSAEIVCFAAQTKTNDLLSRSQIGR